MRQHPVISGPGIRDVIGAWLVCLAVATASFALLGGGSPGSTGRAETSASPGLAIELALTEPPHGRC